MDIRLLICLVHIYGTHKFKLLPQMFWLFSKVTQLFSLTKPTVFYRDVKVSSYEERLGNGVCWYQGMSVLLLMIIGLYIHVEID